MSLRNKGVYLKGLVEAQGLAATVAILGLALEKRELRPEDFSIKQLAEAFYGDDWVRQLEPQAGRGGMQLVEDAPGGVDSSNFANITGQIIYSKISEGYRLPQFVADRLCTTVPTVFHDGEKVPDISAPQGTALEVKEGMTYPEFGMSEDYIETPATEKDGLIVSITKEAIAKDRTGIILQRALKVGERIGLKKEYKVFDVVLGLKNTYKWKGTTYANYLTSGGWINDKASAELVDWTSLEDIMIQLTDIVNPQQTDDNEPVPPQINDLLVMPYKEVTAKRILMATQIRQTTNTNNVTIGDNPQMMNMNLISSAIAYQRLIKSGVSAANAKQYYFAGDFKRAFWYMEVYPLTVTQAAQNSTAEFERDIVARFKAAERGIAVCAQPRYVARRYVS